MGRLAARLDPEPRSALVEGLRIINQEFRETDGQPILDGRRAWDLNHRFHDRIRDAAAGRRLSAALKAHSGLFERYERHYYMIDLAGVVSVSANQHDGIIEAIERGDVEGAERRIRANRLNDADQFAEIIESQGEQGTW